VFRGVKGRRLDSREGGEPLKERGVLRTLPLLEEGGKERERYSTEYRIFLLV
jgi:hypothetical protein